MSRTINNYNTLSHMFKFHQDKKKYFQIQSANAANHVIPFIEERFIIRPGMRVLEIGCGEAGVLKAFIDKGCTGVGIEPDMSRVINANAWLKKDIASGTITLIPKDVYLTSPDELGIFDIIILKDVIEHIHDQQRLVGNLRGFLKAGGIIYFGFPPWQMPFGGHQQMCRNKLPSRTPYYHLLPRFLYKAILKKYDEPVAELLEIRDTRISIERFEKIVRQKKYRILHSTFFITNPIYQQKFGWKVRKQFFPLNKIPFVRNFFTSCVYYIITPI